MREPLDAYDGVNTEVGGRVLAEALEMVLKRERVNLPGPVKVLFLGAGSARAELAYVSQLGINLSQVTLVDRYDDPKRARLQSVGFGAVVSRDIFNFMEQVKDEFSLVVGLGIEYVVEANPREFFDGLAKVVKSGGVAHLSAPPHIDSDYWGNQGFRAIGRARLILVKN